MEKSEIEKIVRILFPNHSVQFVQSKVKMVENKIAESNKPTKNVLVKYVRRREYYVDDGWGLGDGHC